MDGLGDVGGMYLVVVGHKLVVVLQRGQEIDQCARTYGKLFHKITFLNTI